MKIVKLNLIILLLIPWLLQSNPFKHLNKQFVVVLDAGHGGYDSGNIGNGYLEKKIALTITLEIGRLLSKHKEIEVIYTRKDDKFVDLFKRAQIANDADADLFISIHCDAFPSPNVYGAGTFVLGLHANERNFEVAKKENSVIFLEDDYEKNYDGFNPNSPESVISLLLMQEEYLEQSIVAATAIQKSFISVLGRKDRTVKQAGFIVLKYTYMPSVLVETGFLTNKNEGAYLNSSEGKNSMAKTISKAIVDYKNQLNSLVLTDEPNNIIPKSNDEDPILSKKTVSYKVQISASENEIEAAPYNFKGLKPIYRVQSGSLFRYYYGNSSKFKNAKKDLRKAKNKGFKSAFLIAFLNDKSISIEEAKKHE